MNKTIISVLVIFFVGLVAFQSVNAASIPEYGYQIEVTKTSFLPSTIYAGDIINMEVELKNRSSETQLTGIEGKLELGDQFKGINTVESISYIRVGETKTLAFEFQAKVGASSGYYSVPLTITYLSGSDSLKQTQIILVPVSKTDKNLDITIDPSVVNPGKPTEVVFTIKNVGNTPVSNISLSWVEENDLVLPLGSDNKRYVNILEANQEAGVSYLVAADPNITPGIYPLDISVTFNDINGTRTQTSNIGLLIGGTTEFEISAEMLTGQISISIANIGSNNAKAVVVRIPDQPGVTVGGSNTSILGNLNEGDYTLANFEIRMTSIGERQQQPESMAGKQPTSRNALLIEIDYTDTTGERQSIQKQLELNTAFSSTEEGQEGLAGSTMPGGFAGRAGRQTASDYSTVSWILLAAILVGAAAFNKFKAGNKNWKKLGIILAGIAALFLVVIFLLGSNLIAILLATAVSLGLLAWFFRKEQVTSLLKNAMRFLKKQKE